MTTRRRVLVLAAAALQLVGAAPVAAAHEVRYAGIGPVIFPGGHIVPDVNGEAIVIVADDILSQVGFTYCQGEGIVLCRSAFGSVTLAKGMTWNPALELRIIVDGGLMGNPSVCGGLFFPGSTGTVNHT